MPREDLKRNTQNVVNDTQVMHHLKYLFANTSANDEDEIYPITVSEIAVAQKKHRLFKRYFKDKPSKVKTNS